MKINSVCGYLIEKLLSIQISINIRPLRTDRSHMDFELSS